MQNQVLSEADQAHFLERGYVIVRGAVPHANVQEWQQLAWKRLGIDPNDQSTWAKDRIHLPPSRVVEVEHFAPRAFGAMCELLGGRERILEPCFWGDVFIANLSEGSDRPYQEPSAQAPGWHKDGYGRHFLDSSEQALLVLVAWTDVLSRGGGTFIAPDSVGFVSRFLAEHPEGVSARDCGPLIAQCHEFEEMTADAGDVILLHPFMLHAVSQNVRRIARVIANPIIHFREPMNFNRENADEFSLVERATLRHLGVERLDFHPTSPREEKRPAWLDVARDRLSAREPGAVVEMAPVA